ncbi:hypothetical protein [Deinococcus arenicola]|uniref:Terminase small subunit n=1 Tax=Deinococcus arenicola TaxID=2994950 RepID=A0ABU4DLB1_9DEIO|nr:hypothetical protein [Deinococcus sp. ZS9-10]MDV6373216.1 hypothetical protein [Deinococcus sp. ZS9-10]
MTLKSERLYLEYIGLGTDRTIPKLSKVTGQSIDSLYKMSKRYEWAERAALDDKALKEKFSNSDYSELGAGEILAGISRKSLEKLDRVISTVKVSNPRDAKIMLELSQLAAGKPTEIQQTISNDDNLISVSILLDIIEMLPKEWQDKANAELEKRISGAIDDNLENNPQQFYN